MDADFSCLRSAIEKAEAWLVEGRRLERRAVWRRCAAIAAAPMLIYVVLGICLLGSSDFLYAAHEHLPTLAIIAFVLSFWFISVPGWRKIAGQESLLVAGNALYRQVFLYLAGASGYDDPLTRKSRFAVVCYNIERHISESDWPLKQLRSAPKEPPAWLSLISESMALSIQDYVRHRVRPIVAQVEDMRRPRLGLEISILRWFGIPSMIGGLLLIGNFDVFGFNAFLQRQVGMVLDGSVTSYLVFIAGLGLLSICGPFLARQAEAMSEAANNAKSRHLLVLELRALGLPADCDGERGRQFVERCEAIIAASNGSWMLAGQEKAYKSNIPTSFADLFSWLPGSKARS